VGLLGIPGGLFLFMSRQFDIIKDLEIEYDKQLDVNFDPGVDGLCDGRLADILNASVGTISVNQ
jgi:hypothetical protein